MNLKVPIQSIQQVVNNTNTKKPVNESLQKPNQSFETILQSRLQQAEELKFSKHASQRLEQRNIRFTQDQLQRLDNGIEDAKAKGIKESLVFMDNVALVVNIPSKTVITAIEKNESDQHIFTNINGAVIL